MSTNTCSMPISTVRRRPRRDTSTTPRSSVGTCTRRPSVRTRMATWRRFRLLNRPNVVLRSWRPRGFHPAVRRVYQQRSIRAPCPSGGAGPWYGRYRQARAGLEWNRAAGAARRIRNEGQPGRPRCRRISVRPKRFDRQGTIADEIAGRSRCRRARHGDSVGLGRDRAHSGSLNEDSWETTCPGPRFLSLAPKICMGSRTDLCGTHDGASCSPYS